MHATDSASWPRRRFLGAAGAFLIVPASIVRGQDKPSGHMAYALIGCGRMGRGDIAALMRTGLKNGARVIAACDVDANRARSAAKMIDKFYQEKLGKDSWGCTAHTDHQELLAKPGLDGVVISTPDHQHAVPAMDAAKAGKHIYLQKPLTWDILEGRELVKTVREHDIVLQVGSQQRSSARFRHACELARNGRLGKVHTITAQLPSDSGTGVPTPMPVPDGLDYKAWLGPLPADLPYTEHRVHPKNGFGRPGWLQIEATCRGMITGWGAHMLDIAQWAHGCDNSGPVEAEGAAAFPDRGLFDVHTNIDVTCRYADGVVLHVVTGPAGVKIEGDKGELFVSRSALKTEPRSLAKEQIGANETRLYKSNDHMADFLQCARAGKDPVAPVETGHRSNSACVITHLAAKLGRKLRWDPAKEAFLDDDEANAHRGRV